MIEKRGGGSTIDLVETLLKNIGPRAIKARLVAQQSGVISGASRIETLAREIGLGARIIVGDGLTVDAGGDIARFEGEARQVVKGEEVAIGAISKFSGVATAAARAVGFARGRFDVVCGAWKKMPIELKTDLRSSILAGGAKIRITDEPFVYLDKNYVRIFGDVRRSVEAARPLGKKVCVQVRGETGPVDEEAQEAAEAGASIIMVDTGAKEDLEAASKRLRSLGLRGKLKLAFAGEIDLEDIHGLIGLDIDMVDIGYAIIDAPCLRMKYEVYG